MGKTRVFFPQEALDRYILSGEAELYEDELRVPAENRRYHLEEAVRVLAEVTGMPDAFGVIGTVRTVEYVFAQGGELLGGSMVLGENAYSIAYGWLGTVLDELPIAAPSAEVSDAKLLADFLARTL